MPKEKDLTQHVSEINEHRAAEVAAQNYATVSDQIEEERARRAGNKEKILAYRDAIRALQEDNQNSARREHKLRMRRRVFANAAHALRMIDED